MAAKRVVWTKDARDDFKAILDFYNHRNGSKTYSQKLAAEIFSLIRLLPENNYLGLPVKNAATRVIFKGVFNIFYEVTKQEIVILMVWDSRRNPDDLQKFIARS